MKVLRRTKWPLKVDVLAKYIQRNDSRMDSWAAGKHQRSYSTCVAYLRDNEWKYDEVPVTETECSYNGGKRYTYEIELRQRSGPGTSVKL